MSRSGLVGFFLTLVLINAGSSAADNSCRKDCRQSIECEIKVADCFLKAGLTRQLIEYLKPKVVKYPHKPVFARLLAKAYLAENNSFWAQKVLKKAIRSNLDDCQSRAWLAWLYINQGLLDMAQEILEHPSCPATLEDKTRWLLFDIVMAKIEKDQTKIPAQIQRLSLADSIYPEDHQLWSSIRKQDDIGWIDQLTLSLDLFGGYTSNATAGSATDPDSPGSQSALMGLDLYTRLVTPANYKIRPTLTANVSGHGLSAEDSSDFSFLEYSIQPGIIISQGTPRWTLNYNNQVLYLNRDTSEPFYVAHRAEIELDYQDWTVFAGIGHRSFQQSSRTRTEFDGGLGGSLSLLEDFHLMYALATRYYPAAEKAYDLVGANGLLVGRMELSENFYLRLALTAGFDYYPRSGETPGMEAFGTTSKRFELLSRLSCGLWSTSLAGFRWGLTYDLSWRDSTADTEISDYDYIEHRILFTTRLTFDFNPQTPTVSRQKKHVAWDYGIERESKSAIEDERIQDLLRRDQLDRSGLCGCGQ
jgi:hypothetical protein